MQLNEFEQYVKTILHPAGLKLFADHQVLEVNDSSNVTSVHEYSDKIS